MNDPIGPDSEHDAWLREALRHAPDAGVAPPSSVSELILREAQAKARGGAQVPAPVPTKAGGWAAFWSWLARPQVAAGAASVMIATVAGVMWWDRPIDDDRGPPLASAPAPATQTAAPASAAEPNPVESNASFARAEAKKANTPPPQRAAEDNRKQRQLSIAEADKERVRRAEPDTRIATAAPRAEAADQPRAFPGVAEATADRAAPAAAATAPPVVAPAPATPKAATTAPATTLPAAAPAQRERADMLARDSAVAGAAGTMRLQKSLGATASASAEPTDLAALRQAIAAEPQRWSWQRGAGSPQPADPRLQSWLAEADAAAAPRWRQAAPASAKAELQNRLARSTSAPSPNELRLLRDGRHVATLRLEGRTLRLDPIATDDQPAIAQRAELDPAAAQALHQSLP